MKALILFTLFLLASSGVSTLDLTDAVTQKKVTIKSSFSQLGNDGITLQISNTSAETINLKIASGTLFYPESDDEQVLMNVDEQMIALAPKQSKTVVVDGYCTMLSKNCPSKTNNFKVAKNTQTNLNSFVNFLKTNKVSKENYQSAIWAITDNEDIAAIDPKTEADKALRKHIATMTNRKDPWYNRAQNIVATPGVQIERRSANIDGMLEINPATTMEIAVTVEDDKGNIKMQMPKTIRLDKGIQNSFSFNVKVGNWEVGKYHVMLRKVGTKEKIKQFDFTV
ncbi:MAG TPA: hypothetical protein PLP27_11155 [Crocinitomicaceae bacterium]|nr:hypothetical protein [Crocinitomicaceae bacterium]